MKIIQIGPFPQDFSCIKGGVEASVCGLASQLSGTNEVIVADFPRCGVDDSCVEERGMKVYRFGRPGSRNLSALKRIEDVAEIVRKEGADVCHIHGTSVFSYRLFRALREQRKVVTVHGVVFEEKKKALKRHFSLKLLVQFLYQSYYERALLSRAKTVIADTTYVEAKIRSLHLFHCPEIRVIPQGINDSYFTTYKGRQSQNSVVLSVGSFAERKGHLLLMQAFEQVWQNNKSTKLVIAGVVAEDRYYQKMKTFLDSSPCRESIILLPNVSRGRLLDLYGEASVFALHSEEESQGIVFAEAMACGLPIVSTRVGGIPYVVKHNCNGLLCEYGDVVSFAGNILRILEDDNFSSAIGEANLKAAKEYKWAAIAERVEGVYANV